MSAVLVLALTIAFAIHTGSAFATQACNKLNSLPSNSTIIGQFAKPCLVYRAGEASIGGAPVLVLPRGGGRGEGRGRGGKGRRGEGNAANDRRVRGKDEKVQRKRSGLRQPSQPPLQPRMPPPQPASHPLQPLISISDNLNAHITPSRTTIGMFESTGKLSIMPPNEDFGLIFEHHANNPFILLEDDVGKQTMYVEHRGGWEIAMGPYQPTIPLASSPEYLQHPPPPPPASLSQQSPQYIPINIPIHGGFKLLETAVTRHMPGDLEVERPDAIIKFIHSQDPYIIYRERDGQEFHIKYSPGRWALTHIQLPPTDGH